MRAQESLQQYKLDEAEQRDSFARTGRRWAFGNRLFGVITGGAAAVLVYEGLRSLNAAEAVAGAVLGSLAISRFPEAAHDSQQAQQEASTAASLRGQDTTQ